MTYYDPHARSDTADALLGFALFLLTIGVLIAGAAAVLIILAMQETANPSLCITALAIYIMTALAGISVATRHGA